MKTKNHVLYFILGWLIIGISVRGSVVDGLVTQSGGSPFPDVNIDLIDRSTGQNVPIVSGDTTDGVGAFSVDVPDGSYDVTFTPPLGSGFAGSRLLNVAVSGDTTLPSVELPLGYAVSLRVVSISELPVPDVVARFKNAALQDVFVPGNTSEADGALSTVIPQSGGPYTITFRDESGSGFADKVLIGFVPSSDTDLGDVIVGPSQPFAGRTVRYSNGAAVASVDVDVFDACGLELQISGDLTDVTGAFSLAGISNGRYEVIFRPPLATSLDRKTLTSVRVVGAVALGDVQLGNLRVVSGRMVDGVGTPLSQIDLDFTDQGTGEEVAANNDNSIVGGTFAAEVTDGVYTIDFRPRFDLTLAPRTLFDVTVDQNVNLGDVVLESALFLSGTITDQNGDPVEAADLNVFDPTKGLKVYTPEDKSDGAGYYQSRLALGVWTLVYSPPPSRPDLYPVTFSEVSVFANRTLDVVLPTALEAKSGWLYR